ncbi:MAG: chromate resistance protein ChrB domain-containing protein [Gemmatimonadaceae bacterium]
MQWITRERPKIDRVACPWLIDRFIDPCAEFLFVPADTVEQRAAELDATPFDVEGVELSHDGPRCSFDAFLVKYDITDPALLTIATIVRGADTAQLGLAPQSAGLLAISLGLSRLFSDDVEMLRHGFVVYDALYAWCREASMETHDWSPQKRPPGGRAE